MNKVYSVAVDSSGFSADNVDILIVVASDEAEAKRLAEQDIRSNFPNREVTHSEAYPLGTPGARVIGRLVNEEDELTVD